MVRPLPLLAKARAQVRTLQPPMPTPAKAAGQPPTTKYQSTDPTIPNQRAKAIKEWRRAWKLALIEADNPEGRDL